MAAFAPAPGALGGCSLLTAVEILCLVHLIVCIVTIALASSVNPVDYAGVRISPFLQCLNAAWFLLGIPIIIMGGVGAVFRVAFQLKVYLYYLSATLFVAIGWFFVFFKYGNTCTTIQPRSSAFKQEATLVCQASNAMVLFWMLMLVGIVSVAMYVVWSMKEYVNQRQKTELLRYQEPWQTVAALADEMAEGEAGMRNASNTGWEKLAAWAPQRDFSNPYTPHMPPGSGWEQGDQPKGMGQGKSNGSFPNFGTMSA